jgi:D-alanyl-lipoteichoic acid acyltransferase DltB (MBOAT superfamily)
MLFNSAQYGFFLVVVFFVFWSLARMQLLRTLFLLVASYYFYASWNPSYLLLLLLNSLVDYTLGRLIGRTTDRRRRTWLLVLSVCFNLGLLSTFKYFGFFSDIVIGGAAMLGVELEHVQLGVLLPVGISFYTFQSMSYIVDVYRGDIQPERNLLKYMAFVAFFPQLIAGPIVRAGNLLPQLGRAPRPLSRADGSRAILLIMAGLLKKVAIADVLAVNLVDRVFDFPDRFSSIEALAAVYGYALQIYCDFSGYTDIAIGSALLLGVHIPINFDAPYRATDLRDFWRRWHISLSTWLRDYLYKPLGGSRRGPSRTYLNLMITMVLGGLWHGAAWTFVLWGALHGLAQVVTRLAQQAGFEPRTRFGRAVSVVLTFHFVCLCWVLFRSSSLEQAWAVVRQVGTGGWGVANLPPQIAAVLALGFLTHWLPRDFVDRVNRAFASLPAFAQSFVALAVVALVYHVASTDAVPFIYFQF